MSQDEGKKVKLKVTSRAIDESELTFDEKDKFCESGSYGKVRRALFEDRHVAVKYFLSAEQKRGYKQELVFLSTLQNHENIVYLHGTGMSHKQPFIVMEFAPYSLEGVLHGPYPRYSYTAGHVIHWSKQIAVGLKYVHDKRILHRDIKASNLLLFGNGSHLKLCDFGTCRNLETNLLYTANIGTVRYMAPEVIKGEAYTQKCDIFSFAITLWEMLARKVPTVSATEHCNTYAILFQMAEGKRPPQIVNLPSAIDDLINKCWHQDPNVRLSSTVLVNKLNSLSTYFTYGEPLTIETKDNSITSSSTAGDSTITIKPDDSEIDDDETVPSAVEPAQFDKPGSPIVRTQSDLTQVKAYINELEMKKLTVRDLHSQHSIPPVPKRDHISQDLSYGYPPRDRYPSPSNIPKDDHVNLITRKNSSGGSEIHIDHEVHEVDDPNSDDKRYVSMDENMLRFDVQMQYKQLEQAYHSSRSIGASYSLPSSSNMKISRLKSRTSQMNVVLDKASFGSRFAIPHLPPEMQPVLPDENDPESLKIYEQYKKLSSHYQQSPS